MDVGGKEHNGYSIERRITSRGLRNRAWEQYFGVDETVT
jgi:hypothetical protein